MKVNVDRGKCCGAGQCVATAPAVFDQDEDDGMVLLLSEAPNPNHFDDVRRAADVCPSRAITITDDASHALPGP
jgi:ferredoxin